MTRGARLTAGALSCLLLCACAAEPVLTPAQREALEVRTIEAPADQTLRAAAGVLMDQGYLITLSDADAGLVGGTSWHSMMQAQRQYHRPEERAAAWVRPLGPQRSALRFRGGPTPDQRRISNFARQVSERTLLWSTPSPKGSP